MNSNNLISNKDIVWWEELYKKKIPVALVTWLERASDDYFEAQAAILDYMERNSSE